MDWSWLLYLMCPLMMIPMLFMMLKGNRDDSARHDQEKLVEELSQLKTQNEMMQKELREMKSNG